MYLLSVEDAGLAKAKSLL